jgi:formamidase
MGRFRRALWLAPFFLAAFTVANADTSDVRHETPVVVAKSGSHCSDDPKCFNRYHPALRPVARARPGQTVILDTRDAFDSNLKLAVDRRRCDGA